MTYKSIIHRYLDPAETLAEVLFGLIMVLTFTIGADLLTTEEQLDAHGLIVAAAGCNVAWGIIDAVLFLLNMLFYRSQRARFYRTLRDATSDTEALAAIQKEYGFEDEPLAVDPADRARLYQSMLVLTSHARPVRVGLKARDFVAAFAVFVLVSATAIPGLVPFMVFDNWEVALRVSNVVLISLLFLVGYWWAHYTDARPLKVAMIVLIMGVAMVLVAVALGG
jgi:VIT1/CCC1 family predicted Fe2+/Mn2+ transporter